MNSLINFYRIKTKSKFKICTFSPKVKNGILIKKGKIDRFGKFEVIKEFLPKWWDSSFFIPIKSLDTSESLNGKVICTFSYDNKSYPAIVQQKNRIVYLFDLESTINNLLSENYVKKKRPLHTKIPFHYSHVPFISLWTYFFYKFRKKKIFPSWPIEPCVELLRHVFLKSIETIYPSISSHSQSFWPNRKKYAISFTHDVDTQDGFNKIPSFFKIEKKYKIRSTWNLVSHLYKWDRTLLRSLIKSGHEIASHGYNHDNKLGYIPPEIMEQRLVNIVKNFENYNLNVRGFRCPSLLITPILFQKLRKYFIYDSSVPDTDPYMTDALKRGCCSVFPFYRDNILEIPLTVPMDSSLLFGGYTPGQILDIWNKKLQWIKNVGGIAVITTHTNSSFSGNPTMLNIYEKFVKKVCKDRNAWIAPMGEVAYWWKKTYKR